MFKPTLPETGSYAGGLISVVGAMTLSQWGVIAGIVTAALTFGLNVWYTRRKNAREEVEAQQRARLADLAERESKARLAALGLKP